MSVDLRAFVSERFGGQHSGDWGQLTNAALDYIEKERPGEKLVISEGRYSYRTTVQIGTGLSGRPHVVECETPSTHAHGARFVNMLAPQTAFEILSHGSELRNIAILGNATEQSAHRPDGVPAIHVLAPCDVVKPWIQNFDGNGVLAEGSNRTDRPSNASGARIDRAEIAGITGHGVVVKGADANNVSVSFASLRNVKGWGVVDESFLGICVTLPMFHTCELGAVNATNGNSDNRRTRVLFHYLEHDTPGGFQLDAPSTLIAGMGGPIRGTASAWHDGKLIRTEIVGGALRMPIVIRDRIDDVRPDGTKTSRNVNWKVQTDGMGELLLVDPKGKVVRRVRPS